VSQPATTVVEISQATFDDAPLPHGWRWVRVGDISNLVNGDAYKPHEWSISGVPIIRIQNLNDESKPFNYWSGSLHNRVRVKAGDILLAWSGTPGTSFGAHLWLRGDGVLNQHIFRVDLKDSDVVPAWFVYAINHRLHILIDKAHGGVGLRHVTKGEVEKLEIPLPPVNEQKRLAGTLSEQLAAVEQARTAAEAQLKAAKDLPAAYMRAVFNSSEASAWDRKKLGEVCEIVARQVDPKIPEYGALPHVNGENIESGTCRLMFLRTAAEDNMTSGKYLFEVGDVLYSKLRPYLRKVIVADFRGVCSADMYPIRVNPDFLNPHFTGWLLVSDEFTKYADEESRRARMPKLNREQLFAWEAPLPPLETQELIIESLSEQMAKSESLASKLKDQLDSINKLPASLLRQAFTGKL